MTRARSGGSRLRVPIAMGLCSLVLVGSVVGLAVPSLGDPAPPMDPVAQLLTPVLNLLKSLSPPAPASVPVAGPDVSVVPATDVPLSSLVADAAVSSVPVYADPDGGPVLQHVSGVNSIGQPEAFLVEGQAPGWFRVELPTRPNESTGWIRATDVTTRNDPYYLRVHQSTFVLDAYLNGTLQNEYHVAVGAPATPTPNGNFYVWASQPWNQAPYVGGIFALSAFSPVLVNWPGGGRTGIHGWRDTSVLGKRASNGCVRMSGADFTALLNSIPLGTPVQIQP